MQIIQRFSAFYVKFLNKILNILEISKDTKENMQMRENGYASI